MIDIKILCNTSLFIVIFTAVSASTASCLPDEPEPGDIGPMGQTVCTDLEHAFPGNDIRIFDRQINSPNDVIILVTASGKPVSAKYHLKKLRWVKW